MKIINKISNIITGKKNFIPGVPLFSALANDGGWYDLIAYQSLLYFRMIAPIYTGTTIICDEIAGLIPKVFDTKKQEFVDHEVLELLNHPFADNTWHEFAKEFSIYYLVTGNNYTVLNGMFGRPPTEMVNVYPSSVNITSSDRDGYNETFVVANSVNSETFKRDEKVVPGYFRFLNQMGNREIAQARTFNARYQVGYGQYGMSALTPIYYELTQHLFASIHNKSILQNGAKVDTVFSIDRQMNQDTFERLKREINNFYSGPQNAGRPFLGENGLTVTQLGKSSMVDMDFVKLKQDATNSIYNSLKVPLPLISTDHTTMNNLEASIAMLYNRAVLPLADRIFSELTLLLMPRYKNSENLKITYRKDDIPALALLKLQELQTLQKLGILTPNELRAKLGYSPLDGGDTLLVPSLDIPLSSVSDSPSPAQSSKSYIEALKNLSFKDGESLLSQKILEATNHVA